MDWSIFFMFFFLHLPVNYAAKLTVPRILLPYNTGIPTNYTLEVKEGNCYKWSSSRYDLVSITALPVEGQTESCTTKAVVSAVSRYPERENAIILAEDERTGQLLRCDVVIDAIHSIEIVTTTRVLFLEDAPEVFEVIAKNDQGDTFSSLEGVGFQWTIEGDGYASDVYGVLRFLKFSDSEYKTPPAIEHWEKQNLHGSMILMEGSKTGTAKVNVRPLDLAYKHVKPDEVSLVIVANLNLMPSHIYVLPGTRIKYQLELIKQGKAYPVSLPSEQYFLEVADGAIASLESSTSTLTALNYGTTNVVVKDKYITDKEHAHLPSSVVHVTVPSYLTLSVQPGEKWSLQEEMSYRISVKIYDRNSYPIHITEEVDVAVSFPSKYFKVHSSTENGTYHEVFTLAHGSCQISAKLIGIKKEGVKKKFQVPVTTVQEVIIYEKIKVHPEVTLLPWDPTVKPSYLVDLTASGGTGSYSWASDKPQLAFIASDISEGREKTRVKTLGQGEARIRATDSHISVFMGTAVVSIQDTVDLKMLPREVEVHLNETLNLPLAMYGYQRPGEITKRLFHDCTQVPLIVDIDELPKFEYINGDVGSEDPRACRNMHLHCFSTGYNRIRVRYEQGDISLKDAAIIACYKKLKAVHPKAEAVVSLGSSSAVIFEGGPKPWVTCKANHFTHLMSDDAVVQTSFISSTSEPSGSIYVLDAVCKGYGESTIQISVGNKPCSTNLHPLNNTALARVICAVPQTLIIKPIVPTLTARRCPSPSEDVVAIHSQQDVMLELVVKDSLGRKFYNISSLDIKWSLSDKRLASFDSYEGFQTKYLQTSEHKIIERNYQELHPAGIEGVLKVTATITGYRPDVLLKNDIAIKPDLPAIINHHLNLNLVEEVEVLPKRISIFNNPASKGYLNVTKGSGHFHIEVSDPRKAKILYREPSRQIEVTPLDTGSFSVTIIDLCMPMKHEVVSYVHVYGISAIILDVLDKVELGKSVIASVEVLNEDKQSIPASIFTLMNLQPVTTTDIISVRLASKVPPDQTHALYQVNGLALGQTSLKFVTTSTALRGQQYTSESYPIQVFPPLRVNPNNITLSVGASFQVICLGGPHPQSSIEYAVEDTEKASVSTGGRVEARKLGRTVLIASSVGYDKNGQRVVYAKDKAAIHVIALQRIKIHSPLTRMIAGSEMPVYAIGLTEEETPFTFGSASPGMEFMWSISNEKVVTVNDVYREVGLQEARENNFCARVKAEQDGHATLRLEVVQKDQALGGRSHVLADEVQIQVFKKLKLTNPEYEDGLILLSPNSELKLRCNRFSPARVTYSIAVSDGDRSSSPVATVDNQGLLKASSRTGTAVLTVLSFEEFGITQHLTVVVKVEEVAFMMMKPVAEVKTRDWPLVYIPVGFAMPFVVTYHDNVGRVFDAARSQLKFRASRLDLARISTGPKNNTLMIQALNVGFTVLKIWDSESFISPDFIKISAGVAIDPPNAEVTVGDVICFGSPLLTQEGHTGVWTADGSSVVVHPSSGGAVAMLPGTSTVTYTLSSEYTTSTQINVFPVDRISIRPGNLRYITNVQRSKPYKIPVVLENFEVHRAHNVIGKNCSIGADESFLLPQFRMPFSCDISFNSSSFDVRASDVFHVESGFDIADGMYFCSVVAKNNVFPIEVSTLVASVIVSVLPLSVTQETHFTSEPLELPFLPAFMLNEDKLVLSSYHSSATFRVTANSAVQECIEVKPSSKNLIDVLPPIRRDSSLIFQVKLLDASQFHPSEDFAPLYLEVSCQKTKQHEQLPVQIKFYNFQYDGGQCLLPPAESTETRFNWMWFVTVCMIIVPVALVSVLIKFCTGIRHGTVTNQPVFLNSSGNGSFTVSPSRLSHSPSPGVSSPHTLATDTVYEALGRPTQMWTIDSSKQSAFPRRRTTNVFQ